MYSYQEKNYRVTSGGTILAPVSLFPSHSGGRAWESGDPGQEGRAHLPSALGSKDSAADRISKAPEKW